MLKHLVLLALIGLSCQLGKSERKRAVVEEEPQESIGILDAEIMENLEFEPGSVTKESILRDHEKVDKSSGRKFKGPAIAYITPWNNKGYDLAKLTADKLTHIAPVWLQIKPQTADAAASCRIEGTHDIDHQWMEALREKNEKIKIVPRVLFEQWSIEQIATMITNERWSNRCLTDLLNFLSRNQFHGAVIELWMDVMSRTRGEAATLLIEFINTWGDAFHKKGLEIIIPVGPPVGPDNQLTGMFMPAYFDALAPHVDYIQIMTYDFPAQSPSGVAPYDWIAGAVDSLFEESPRLADKLLIGLNHYGYQYSSTSVDAIKYDQYLELLKKKNSQLEWDVISREHFVKSEGGKTTYYPSLTSIELRIKLAEKRGVGFAIWDYGQGLNYFSQLL